MSSVEQRASGRGAKVLFGCVGVGVALFVAFGLGRLSVAPSHAVDDARLVGLEARLRRLEALPREARLVSAEGAAAPRDIEAPEDREVAPPASPVLGSAEVSAALATRVATEARDREALQLEETLARAFDVSELRGVRVEATRCVESVCRMAVRFDDDASAQSFRIHAPAVSPLGWKVYAEEDTDAAGRRSAVVYLARPGHALH